MYDEISGDSGLPVSSVLLQCRVLLTGMGVGGVAELNLVLWVGMKGCCLQCAKELLSDDGF